MIKFLSLILSLTATSSLAFAMEELSTRSHKIDSCKNSKQSKNVKNCKADLNLKDRIIILGNKQRSDLSVLDSKGRYFYMPHGLSGHNFKPAGEIEILSEDNKDKALIYKLEYSNLEDSKDKAFRIVTVRLRKEAFNSQKTCVVSVLDSNSHSGDSAKDIEQALRTSSKELVSNDNFKSIDCAQPLTAQVSGLQISKN